MKSPTPTPTEPAAPPVVPVPAVMLSKWKRLAWGSLYGLIVWAIGLPLTPAFFIVAPIVMFPLTWVGYLAGADVLRCNFFCTPTPVGMLISLGITVVLFALANLAVGTRDRWFRVSVFVLLWVAFWVLALAFPAPKTDSGAGRSHDTLPDPRNFRVTFDDGSSASILNGVGVYPQDRYSQPDTFTAWFF
jgi:hypothetical protein